MILKLYTDGSGTHNGPAGWAHVVTNESETEVLHIASGAVPQGTSNTAEMLAVQNGLDYIASMPVPPDGFQIHVYSDSAYVVNAFKDRWIQNWQRTNWRNSRGRPVANKELWVALKKTVDKLDVKWYKCKAHSDIKYNELADRLCGKARKEYIKCHG